MRYIYNAKPPRDIIFLGLKNAYKFTTLNPMGKIHIVQNDVIGCIAALKPFVGLWLSGLGRVCRERKRTVGRAMPTKRKGAVSK